ncbi:hypothetical protein [Ferrimicrobium sp.]|uniref:hypothetical protein n=1 Tax=Ferrimicrobium sp. TaxID=2926050 RepID=UPI0026202497|nr:hypothetical protein [Ferrimicrobium sp.]
MQGRMIFTGSSVGDPQLRGVPSIADVDRRMGAGGHSKKSAVARLDTEAVVGSLP